MLVTRNYVQTARIHSKTTCFEEFIELFCYYIISGSNSLRQQDPNNTQSSVQEGVFV